MLKNQLSIPLLWTLVLENADQLCEVCGLPGMCFFFFFFFFFSFRSSAPALFLFLNLPYTDRVRCTCIEHDKVASSWGPIHCSVICDGPANGRIFSVTVSSNRMFLNSNIEVIIEHACVESSELRPSSSSFFILICPFTVTSIL